MAMDAARIYVCVCMQHIPPNPRSYCVERAVVSFCYQSVPIDGLLEILNVKSLLVGTSA